MLTRLLWRPWRPSRPHAVYYLLGGGTSFFLVLAFTLNQVYYVTVVGLSPLQLVLVGTVLEATCFLLEIPTGVVADLYSRRLSVVIGVSLLGAGMLLQGLVPTFAAVLVAQVVWGTGSTFLSGADQAWLADEIGEDAVGPVFTRETQLTLALTVVATLTAGGLGLLGLGVPVAASGAGLLLLAVVLLLVMPEEHFHRTPAAERATFRHLLGTAREGLRVAHRRPVVRTIALVALVVGLASEAFDRLWTVRVLESFTLAGRRRVRRRRGVVHGDRARRHAGVARRVPGRQPGGATAGPGRAPDLAARLAGRPPGGLRPGGRRSAAASGSCSPRCGDAARPGRWPRRSARRG